MRYLADLTILPANTKTNIVTLKFKIDKGLITWAGVYFPAGCNGRVYTRIIFQAHQIYPRNIDGWCHGEDGWRDGILYFPVTASPMDIVIEAYSDNCNWEHTLTVGIELQPWNLVPAWDILVDFLITMGEALGIWAPTYTQREYSP